MTEFSANSITPYEGILILAITEYILYLKLSQFIANKRSHVDHK